MAVTDQGSEWRGVSGASDAIAPTGLLILFFFMLCLPISLELLGLRLSPIRLLLLATIVPFALKILSGKLGGTTLVDYMLMIYCGWVALALMVVHGPEKFAFAGITAVEFVGGYVVGRVLIRSYLGYRRMIMVHLGSMLFILPFALIELNTGTLVIPSLLDPVFDVIKRGHSAYGRMGLERVYAVFEHPILYGLYCSIAFANLIMLFPSVFMKILMGGYTTFMVFMSLSSAPLLSIMIQSGLLGWNWVMKGRWRLFLILCVTGYVTVDALSNRTPITIIIETMTFNSGTGWTRIAIFEYGIQNAIANPIFGIGFNEWARASWVTGSVDNFWLLTAMRTGFPSVTVLMLAFALHVYRIMSAEIADPAVRAARVGYFAAMMGVTFTLVTVHMWGAVSVFVLFYIGAGAWFYTVDHAKADAPDETPAPTDTPSVRYTRYAEGQKQPVSGRSATRGSQAKPARASARQAERRRA